MQVKLETKKGLKHQLEGQTTNLCKKQKI